MTDRGYFALYRGTLDHPVFANEPYTEREAWIWMLDEAAYRPRRKFIAGRMVSLNRGQLAASQRFMQEKWGWASKGRVERFLKKLKNEAMIEPQNEPGLTVITICNYERFQPKQDDDEPATDHETSQHRAITEPAPSQIQRRKEKKEGNNKEEASLRSDCAEEGGQDLFASNLPAPRKVSPRSSTGKKLATGWPEGFDLDGDLHQYAEEQRIAFQDIPRLWERFKNHHQAKGSTFKDWRAAWRTWVGNEIRFSGDRRQNGAGHSAPDRYDPIEHARMRIQQLSTEEEDTFWPNQPN